MNIYGYLLIALLAGIYIYCVVRYYRKAGPPKAPW